MNTEHAVKTVVIYTDGACRGNPGPGGWGALLRCGQATRELYGGAPQTTNNRMELTAAIRALEALKRGARVELHTDSNYLRQGVTRWLARWKQNGWRTAARKPVKNAELWRALETACARHDIHWHWVKGHSGDAGNEAADALANRGIDELCARP